MIQPWFGVLAVGVVLFSCGGGCAGSGSSPRPSATLLHEGPKEDCTAALNPVECEQLHQFSIVDVRRDGERVGVLVLHEGAQQVSLFLSDDGGRTFRLVGTGGSLIYQYAWDRHVINLLLRAGRAWVLLGTAESVGSQTSSGKALFAEWNLETGELGPIGFGSTGNQFLAPGPVEVSADGTVSVVENWYDPGPGTHHSLIWRWDLSSFTTGKSHTICSHPACYNTVWLARDDAKEWQAFGVRADDAKNAITGQVCRFLNRWRGDSSLNPYGEYNCVPYAQWSGGEPRGTNRFAQAFGADGLLYAIFTRDGRAWARTILPATLTEPAALSAQVDLGPGAHWTAEGFNGRSKWSGLAMVRRPNAAGNTEGTLVRLSAGGAGEVNVPPWPCDGPCAGFDAFFQPLYGALAWLEPLGDGEWLAFWIISGPDQAAHQERLYAERVRETTSPLRLDAAVATDAGSPQPVSPLPAYPGAARATPLSAACAFVQFCGLGNMNECLSRYASNTFTGHGSRDRARQALLDAATGGCASLQAFYPRAACLSTTCEANGWTCSPSLGCQADVTVDPSFCDGRAVGYYCDGNRRVACDSAGGETVLADCAGLDEVCVPGPQAACALPGCSATMACDGDLLTSCQLHEHCDDIGRTCLPDFGCATRTDIPTDARCRWGSDQPFCAGDYWVFCLGDRLHYLNCVDAGFTGCAPFATGVGPARCTP